jgi:hypothetical protein
MKSKANSRIAVNGTILEGRLEYAKELFGSHNYRIFLEQGRLGFESIASPAQVIEAWYKKADCYIDPLDLKRQRYLVCLELDEVMDFVREEQFIRCVYWLLMS